MPTATRTFRVFVSSTFEDLKAERNALQERVFSELVKLCAAKGAPFQAIDLRWRVREEAAYDQRTIQICLTEIARCQKTGFKPNFIVLLGDRYGWIPLPARIVKDEFEPLLAHVTADERVLLDVWYRLDWNAVPPEYLLMPREGVKKKSAQWKPVETQIREVLRRAARAAGLAAGDLIMYEASAIHQEILAGLGTKEEDRGHVFAFLRNPDGPKDWELWELIGTLRRELPEGNVLPFVEGDLAALCRQVPCRTRRRNTPHGAPGMLQTNPQPSDGLNGKSRSCNRPWAHNGPMATASTQDRQTCSPGPTPRILHGGLEQLRSETRRQNRCKCCSLKPALTGPDPS